MNAASLSRRLDALERKLPPPRAPTWREKYPDLPPGAQTVVARAGLDAAIAIHAATGGAPLSVYGAALLMHLDRVIEALRAGWPVPGPLSVYGEIIEPAAVAELLAAVGDNPRTGTR